MRRSLRQTKLTAAGVIVRFQQSFLVFLIVVVLHFWRLYFYFSPSFSFSFSRRVVESCWSTKIGPRAARTSCRETTEKLVESGRQVSDPPERMVGTACTNRWLCLISPAPPIRFVQLPWSFYGPCGHSLPIQSPEGKNNFTLSCCSARFPSAWRRRGGSI